MRLESRPEGSVTVSGRDFPTNKGGLCQKGWTSAALLDAPDRLRMPLVRDTKGGPLREASWEEAYARIVRGVRAAREVGGDDAVAVFGGGGLTNEKAYLLGKFARVVLRTRYVDYNGRFCMSSAAAAANRTFGLDRGMPFPIEDLASAGAILLAGSNVAETMPPFVQHLARARERGGLIVIDPRRSATASLTDDGNGVHLQPLPGADIAVLLGILHVIIASGDLDQTFLQQRTTGWEEVAARASTWWPERVERESGVPASQIRRAAQLLAGSVDEGGSFVLTGRGAEQHARGTDTVQAAINLALFLGLPRRARGGFATLTGQGNGQGGREHGQKSDQLPGYRMITDVAAREHIAGIWGISPQELPGPGVPAVELLHRLGTPDGPRMLFVHGSNLAVSAPNAERARERLTALDTLVVCDIVPSETTEYADVVLPTTQWAEEEGTMTNLEGRLLRRRRAQPPPNGVRDELQIWHDLALLLGSNASFSTAASEVFDELAAASAGGRSDYSGTSHLALDAAAVGPQWPVGTDSSSTPRPFIDRFSTPDGRAVLHDVVPGRPSDDLGDHFELYLVTGRLLAHYQSGAQTRRVAELVGATPGAFVALHPLTAQRLGVDEGELVEVTSRRGSAVGIARITRDLRPDVVFMPFHFAKLQAANNVTSDVTDPVSGMPEFKVSAVQVRAVDGAWYKTVAERAGVHG
ncbi:molybdopterin oxidoreductase family protein [Epidermidibacterium keratini]